MSKEEIKKLKSKLNSLRESRNKEIIQQLALQDKTYREIAEDFGLSRQMVRVVARKFKLNFPLIEGTAKYKKYISRVKKALKNRKVGKEIKENKQKNEN